MDSPIRSDELIVQMSAPEQYTQIQEFLRRAGYLAGQMKLPLPTGTIWLVHAPVAYFQDPAHAGSLLALHGYNFSVIEWVWHSTALCLMCPDYLYKAAERKNKLCVEIIKEDFNAGVRRFL